MDQNETTIVTSGQSQMWAKQWHIPWENLTLTKSEFLRISKSERDLYTGNIRFLSVFMILWKTSKILSFYKVHE